MNKELSDFAGRLRRRFFVGDDVRSLQANTGKVEPTHLGSYDDSFDSFALELFKLQFEHNHAYRKICQSRGLTPEVVERWTQIPAAPTSTFKEVELSCIPPEERTAVFHSSGTTEQIPSRHHHNAESLALYEASLWPWFARHVVPERGMRNAAFGVLILTPPPGQAPHSSLVHMFETVRSRACESPDASFFGMLATDGSWVLDFDATLAALNSSLVTGHPALLLGTAFSFVHLLDFLGEHDLRFQLPAGSRVLETGGYKNRSRAVPKDQLHSLITERLGVQIGNIVCEYGMSELSSQAYDSVASDERRGARNGRTSGCPPAAPKLEDGSGSSANRHFRFPPWARLQIISPETGCEVAEGETGLIRVFDLANVFSVMAIQTEDLGIRRGDGFELIGRAQLAEPRGCSLMTV